MATPRVQVEEAQPFSPSKAERDHSFGETTNKNVEWISYPGAWAFYVGLILMSWLIFSLFMRPGMAWTFAHLTHGVLTYLMLHHIKGSPVESDQGKYDDQTFWEQLDGGVQHTANRKFFTMVPVVLFLLATWGSDYRKQPLGLNLVVLVVLVLAKLPSFHRVRIMGINKY